MKKENGSDVFLALVVIAGAVYAVRHGHAGALSGIAAKVSDMAAAGAAVLTRGLGG